MSPAAKEFGERVAFSSPFNSGMSIRTWLVGKAISGLLASAGSPIRGLPDDINMSILIAKMALGVADAALEELAKEEK